MNYPANKCYFWVISPKDDFIILLINFIQIYLVLPLDIFELDIDTTLPITFSTSHDDHINVLHRSQFTKMTSTSLENSKRFKYGNDLIKKGGGGVGTVELSFAASRR